LLDISLFDPSDFPQPGGTARVATAVDEAHQAVLGGALRRDIRIERTEDAHLAAAIDKDRLVQVLIILLDNAIKHGRENGLITIAARRADGFVELVVDDDGPGIEAADRERIFSLAWRGASSGASGWGIGLAVARRMLERAGGRIEAGDSPLGGARFLVRLSVSAETGSTKEPLPPGRR
jgi:signal transduction histidine kinase